MNKTIQFMDARETETRDSLGAVVGYLPALSQFVGVDGWFTIWLDVVITRLVIEVSY